MFGVCVLRRAVTLVTGTDFFPEKNFVWPFALSWVTRPRPEREIGWVAEFFALLSEPSVLGADNFDVAARGALEPARKGILRKKCEMRVK